MELEEDEKIIAERKGAVFDSLNFSSANIAKTNKIILTNKRLILPVSPAKLKDALPAMIFTISLLRFNEKTRASDSLSIPFDEIKGVSVVDMKMVFKMNKVVALKLEKGTIYFSALKGWLANEKDIFEFAELLKNLRLSAKSARKPSSFSSSRRPYRA
jgi:hypothetical protein